MKAVFADAFYWTALTSTEDSFHTQALTFSRTAQPQTIITTDEVLDEYLAFFSGARASIRIQAANMTAQLLSNVNVLVIPQSRETFLEGLALYRARPDKGYSLTDCISMQTMRRERLTDVLTNHRHFEQEGFRVISR